mmetsp:Transcript_10605/g.31626  ORF Transcript_10605/g.31626 Transcript_10605/m.31626 type:complete len:317 (-) Transcript_10605:116-1066(-)
MADFAFAKGGCADPFPGGKPRLEPAKVLRDGLAFVGLSLSRNYGPDNEILGSHEGSVTRQTQFDMNLIQDREYKYYAASDDDGWLCGGGEDGSTSKLPNVDSAHVAIVNVGTFREDWGGVSRERLREAMGKILIPHVAITPSFVMRTGDAPPEVELKFELEPDPDTPVDAWPNWALEFVRNQLYDELDALPARFTPGAFRMTLVRRAGWRDAAAMKRYFEECSGAVERWRLRGPTLLEPEKDPARPGYPKAPLGEELTKPHGLYLFHNRNDLVEYFPPNWEGPYDTEEARARIRAVLSKRWNEDALKWVGPSILKV